MKNILKRAFSCLMAASVLLLGSVSPSSVEHYMGLSVTAASGEAEAFLESGYDLSNVEFYNTNTKFTFNMNGRTFYQGMVFTNSKDTAQVSYDVENVETLFFTIGHVDNTDWGAATIKFYLDGVEYDKVSLSWTMELMEYELDVSGVSALRIVVERSNLCSYAIADVSVDDYVPAKSNTIPIYSNADEFLNSGISVLNMSIANPKAKNPEFYMNGRDYYQGLVFYNTKIDSQVIYNVENVETLAFTIGHIDNTSDANATARFYLDNEAYDTVDLYWNMNLLEYEIDVSYAKLLRIEIDRGGTYASDECGYAFGDFSVDSYEPARTCTVPTYNSAEEFYSSGYETAYVTIPNTEAQFPEYYMNGRSYYQGLVFSNTKYDAQVCYNVENVDTLSFTIGHIDNSGTANATAKFYLDNKEYASVALYWTMGLLEFELDVSNAKVLRIWIDRGGSYASDECGYAFGDFSMDSYSPIKTNTIPTYSDADDFLNSGFTVSQLWIANPDAKNPEFSMKNQEFYHGLVFDDTTYTSQVSYNVETIDTIKFTIGHVDGARGAEATLVFYHDTETYDTLYLTSDMENMSYTMDVSNVAVLRIVLNRKGGYSSDACSYALGDVTIVSKSDEITSPDPEILMGDCNNDGVFNLVDIITLQHWLLNDGTKLANWKAADFYEDEIIDVFDLALMKRMLING